MSNEKKATIRSYTSDFRLVLSDRPVTFEEPTFDMLKFLLKNLDYG